MSRFARDRQRPDAGLRGPGAGVIGSLAALIAAGLLMLAATVYLASLSQDRLQAASEQRIVGLALERLGKAIATNARDYAWWNEAVENLTLTLDEAWAEVNIGPYVHATFGYEVVVVVAGDGRPLIGWLDGAKADEGALSALLPGLSRLLAEARRRGGAAPEPVAGVVPGHDALLVAAASPIVPQPDYRGAPPPSPPALLVFAKRLDQPFLAQLEHDFGLQRLRVAAAGADPGGQAHVDLHGPAGEAVQRLVWLPKRPGREQLALLAPALLGALAVFGLFTRVVLQSVQRSTVAIRASEARFRTITEATSDWVWETDPELRLTYLSEHFRCATGLSPSDALGQRLADVLAPEEGQQARLSALLAAREPLRDLLCLLPHPHGDGSRTLRVAGTPVHGADGTFLGYRGIAIDITAEMAALRQVRLQERQALESLAAAKGELERLNAELEQRVEERTREREAALAQLFQAQKMEAVGQLTGGVAHDFNNLLMAALTNLELAEAELADNPKALHLVEGAIQAAERGTTLIERLLAFACRQDLQPRAVGLSQLVRGLAGLLQRSVGPLVRLEVDAPEGLPPARVDPHQLELALLNLAVNARDAMPTGGVLTVAVARDRLGAAHLSGLAPGVYLRVDVTDNGSGMGAATLRRAVEPFFSTKGPGKGTGLGLSMVHGLAAQSGGALHLASRLGEGTTATLWLPLAEAGRAAGAPAGLVEPVEAPVRRATILVVDDDALVCGGTVQMLGRLGHTAVEADSGEEALAILRARADIDLLMTDYAMPGMNGLALVAAAQALRPGLPAILATGYAEVPAGVPVGLPRLGKPYRQAKLAATLRELLPWTAVVDAKVVPLPRQSHGR
jgi:PAS domain S-box-containing protein